MRRALLLSGLWFIGTSACGGDDSSSGGGGSRGGATGGDAGAVSAGAGGTGGSSSGGAPTGGNAGSGGSSSLILGDACDITSSAEPCGTGICAGTPSSGFFCREVCATGTISGDVCGSSGVCLPAGGPNPGETLACFEIETCDYVTSAGCDTAGGEACVVVDFEPLRTACAPAGSIEAWETCDASAESQCAPGLACLGSDLEDAEPGRCTPLCDPGASLPTGCTQCIALTPDFGSCAECSVLLDDCAAGSHCYPVSEALGGICVEIGPTGAGEECTYDPSGSCQAGMLCMERDNPDGPDPLYCVETCDPQNPLCSDPALFCNDIGVWDAAFTTGQLALCMDTGAQLCWPTRGVACADDGDCLGSTETQPGFCVDRCDPTQGEAACADNYACLPTSAGEFFLDAFLRGNGACGSGCSVDADCAAGATCVALDGLEVTGVCGPTCDPASSDPCPTGGTCVAQGSDPTVGACLVALGSCDPTAATDECQVGTTCTPVSGAPTSGACLLGCHVQNPEACVEAGGSCQLKTDPVWHTGSCLGSPDACDVVAQTGCDSGQNCGILAGSAIGGQAFVCDDAGSVLEGGDCSDAGGKCVTGLVCLADVCRTPCDPSADACPTGSCEDLSASYYLVPMSLGACSLP